MADIVIPEFIDETALADLSVRWTVLYDPSLVERQADLPALLDDARALIVRNRTQVTAALLEAAPKLQVIGRLGVGLDNIDLPACEARGVAVRPARGANEAAVAEYVIAALLILFRRAFDGREAMQGGAWPRNALIGREVAGKRLGLIGFGANARETARRAEALGMTIAAYDPFLPADAAEWALAERQELATLLSTSDAVSLHVPLTAETRGLIDRDALARMRAGAILINPARGGIIEEAALIEALRSGHLSGAALDVYETEPLDAQAGARFADLPNLLLTPHIAGVTEESNIRVSRTTVRNVIEVLEA
ncbi:MAG: hydroxyacid dehydrogenase [Alphaproteobacteria bacterium]|nr:hydroxyacid dehydrogenase [Alphaproteobacteria bacterium]